MKRLLKVMALLVCASMFVFSCNNAADPDDDTASGQTPAPEKPTETPEEDVETASLDLQLKINGQVTSLSKSVASRAVLPSLERNVATPTSFPQGNKLSADWKKIEFGTQEYANKVEFYDYTDGNKGGIIIKGFSGYLQGNYIDGGDKFSNYFRDYSAENGLYFPFVEPGKKTKLWLQGSVEGNFVQGFVTLTPAHGYGVPDDLPDITPYMTYDAHGNATVNNVTLTKNDYTIEYAWQFYDEEEKVKIDNKTGNPWKSSVIVKREISVANDVNGNPTPRNYTCNYDDAIKEAKRIISENKEENAFQINCLKDVFSHDKVYAWVRVTFCYKMDGYDEVLSCPQFDFSAIEDTAKLYKGVEFLKIPAMKDLQPKLNGETLQFPETTNERVDSTTELDSSKVIYKEFFECDANDFNNVGFYDYKDTSNENDPRGGIYIKGFTWVQIKRCYGGDKDNLTDSFRVEEGIDGSDGIHFPFVTPDEPVTLLLQGNAKQDGNTTKGVLAVVEITPEHGYGVFDDIKDIKSYMSYDAHGNATVNNVTLLPYDYDIEYAWYFFNDEELKDYKGMIVVKDKVTKEEVTGSNGSPIPRNYTTNYADALGEIQKLVDKTGKTPEEIAKVASFKDAFSNLNVYARVEVTFFYKIPDYDNKVEYSPPHFYFNAIEDTAKLYRDVKF